MSIMRHSKSHRTGKAEPMHMNKKIRNNEMLKMEYEKYATTEEDESDKACIDHRTQNGLSEVIDTDDMDCESECEVHETCPLNPKNEVI